jgi:deoxyribodipyrimidine photolyase
VKTHRSDSQNKIINTLPKRQKPPRTQGKQSDPSQQYTGSFLPENRKENTIKLHNPEESEDQNTTENWFGGT